MGMDLTHSFTVPTSPDRTWEHFQDLAALAECFPGAQVTEVDGDTFSGTCKVKLGPIALVYTGSGTFTERDEAARRFVVDAKGRDKRGNGTAGATVTVQMEAAEGDATHVEVHTDLSITGKPAQFGRGVMQDVSDKLLAQFVDCLEQRLTDGPEEQEQEQDQDAEPASRPTGAAAAAPAGDQDAGPASEPAEDVVEHIPEPAADASSARPARPGGADSPRDDALDLGATVLPILLRSYWKQTAAGAAVLLALVWLLRRVMSSAE